MFGDDAWDLGEAEGALDSVSYGERGTLDVPWTVVLRVLEEIESDVDLYQPPVAELGGNSGSEFCLHLVARSLHTHLVCQHVSPSEKLQRRAYHPSYPHWVVHFLVHSMQWFSTTERSLGSH